MTCSHGQRDPEPRRRSSSRGDQGVFAGGAGALYVGVCEIGQCTGSCCIRVNALSCKPCSCEIIRFESIKQVGRDAPTAAPDSTRRISWTSPDWFSGRRPRCNGRVGSRSQRLGWTSMRRTPFVRMWRMLGAGGALIHLRSSAACVLCLPGLALPTAAQQSRRQHVAAALLLPLLLLTGIPQTSASAQRTWSRQRWLAASHKSWQLQLELALGSSSGSRRCRWSAKAGCLRALA